MIAMGEDDLGNSIGATLHSFNLNLTGGFAGVGGFVDNSLKISGDQVQNICVNTAGLLEVSSCDGTQLLNAAFVNGQLQIDNISGAIAAGSQIKLLGEGSLQGTLSVGSGCAYLEGDPFKDPFECDTAGTPLLSFVGGVLDNLTTVLELDGKYVYRKLLTQFRLA